MGIRINSAPQGERKSFFSPDLYKVLGMILTIQATIGVAILARSVLHLDTVTDSAAAQTMLNEGEGMAMAFVLFCRMGGGIAWLLFAQLAVTGFQYTRDCLKYLARVGILALASEIPYDLCTYGTWFSFQSQNVVFSILLGLAILYLAEDVVHSRPGRIALMVGGVLWTILLNLQYGYLVVVSMYLFYYLEDNKALRSALILGLSALDVLFLGFYMALISTIIPAALGLLLLHWYDDRVLPRLNKWIPYGVYFAHLVILAVICMCAF